jgi:CRISP-associated protein Cas1
MQIQRDNNISTQESTLFSQLAASGGLWLAWQKVRGNAGGAGGDGIGMAAFERSAPARLTTLSAALRDGHYRPGPYRHVLIPKKHGGERPLDIPCIGDRVVQAAAAMLLTPIIDPLLEDESYAYRPGKSVGQAVAAIVRARRAGYRWTAEGDVSHCFEEIPHAPLLETLFAACGDHKLVDLVGLWLECFAPMGVGIPQGSPISPMLCNLHLDAVDEAITGHGVKLVRFADDFVLMTKSEGEAAAALEKMAGLLRACGLSMNPDKTHIRAFDQSLRFLGHVFTRSMAWKEVEVDDTPAFPDAPPEEMLAAYELPAPDPVAMDQGEARDRRTNVLYIVESGCRLTIRNEAFVVEAKVEASGEEPARAAQSCLMIHANRLDRIEIGPHSSAEWAALSLAAAHGVPVAMTDGWGQTMGWWNGAGDMRAERILTQAKYLAHPTHVDTLATSIVRGRVRNQRAMLRRLNRDRKDPDIVAAAREIEQVVRILKAAGDALPLETVRGYEGLAGRHYWPALVPVFDPAFGYQGLRERRPPPDPINACLGYLYALLERDIRVAIERAGLHPGMGSLHVARAGNEALIYDLMEAFRAPVSESILTTMAGRRHIKPDQFVIVDTIDDAGNHNPSCRMEKAARKALIEGHESWLGRTIQSRRTGQKILWRALFEEEARALGALFAGEAESFVPYELDH